MLAMKRQLGFTLIELIIVLVIGAILAAVAIPSYSDFVKDNRISASANALIGDLYYARTEAIKRNRRVSVCKSANPTATTPGCDTANNVNWGQGWIVFVDDDTADGQRVAAEQLLRVQGPLEGELALAPRTADTAIQYYISYIPRGITQQVGGNAQNGIMRLCDDRGLGRSRAIVISQTGRVNAVAPPDSAAQVGTCP